MAYVVHIAAGSLSLVVGYIALYSAKGGTLHRRAGMLFVYAMLAMCAFGATIAATRDVAAALNVPVAILTSYLVVTALTTVRPANPRSRWLDVASTLVGLGVGLTFLTFGFEAVINGGDRNGMPAFPFLMFGVVGVLAGAGDLRVMRSGALRGRSRLARHLWRMSFALFTASLSFFIGQARVIPEPIRIRPLLALPVLAVLVTMFYWLWRVRIRRSVRGIVRLTAPEAV
jgi:uncharacterized membrane protein